MMKKRSRVRRCDARKHAVLNFNNDDIVSVVLQLLAPGRRGHALRCLQAAASLPPAHKLALASSYHQTIIIFSLLAALRYFYPRRGTGARKVADTASLRPPNIGGTLSIPAAFPPQISSGMDIGVDVGVDAPTG
jgi:hypothetical protein